MLQRLDADIVGLLEVYAGALRYLLRSLREYEAVGAGRGRRGGGERCPVLVRSSRFRVLDASTRWFGTTPDAPGTRLPGARSPRVATVVRLHALDVANTHLDERLRENRRASLTQLAGWVEPDHPTIVMGDFNTTPDDDAAFAVVRASGLRPALDRSAPGTAHRFRGGTAGPRLDHILVSSHFEVVEASIVADDDRPLPSDHWPVRAVLRLSPTGAP